MLAIDILICYPEGMSKDEPQPNLDTVDAEHLIGQNLESVGLTLRALVEASEHAAESPFFRNMADYTSNVFESLNAGLDAVRASGDPEDFAAAANFQVDPELLGEGINGELGRLVAELASPFAFEPVDDGRSASQEARELLAQAKEHELNRVVAAKQLSLLADIALRFSVAGAKSAGATWRDIGEKLGVSGQAAHSRYADSGFVELIESGISD